MIYPIDAVVAVTYRCQARCRTCSVWKIEEHDDVEPGVYGRLPRTLNDVNISGGEPFLRKDLPDIVKIIHERIPRARMVVSTNGFMGKEVVSRALELTSIYPGIGFAVSLDGVGDKHDYMRGIEGGFKKAVSVVEGLKKEGIDNIRIAFTLTTENHDHMIEVYRLSHELGVEFTMQVAHDSDFFFGRHSFSATGGKHPVFGSDAMRADFEEIINTELSSFNAKRCGRAFIFYGSYKLAAEGVQLFSSRPGTDYFFLGPNGDVYPSVLHGHVMGNLAKDDFDTLWASKRADDARAKCLEDSTPSWLGCMLRKALLDRKFQIGAWILKHKLKRVRL